MTDREWEERQKTRQLEMEAVSKALSILSTDDAHNTFTSTFNPSFIQMSMSELAVRSQASKLLLTVSKKLQNPRLAALATSVRLDAFTRVIKAIDGMIAQLQKEKQDEIKQKDFCIDEFAENKREEEKKQYAKDNLVSKIADLELTIKTVSGEISVLKEQIAEMQAQLKAAGETREKENKEFQSTVADQRATQTLLKSALKVLQDVYNKKANLALVQGKQVPPAGFDTYEKSAGSGGVLSMIQQIINDAKAMEEATLRSETEAQQAYESFVLETNKSIQVNSDGVVDKTDVKAKAEEAKIQATESKEAVMLELEQLSNSKVELHQSCDFVMKNFEVRQTARDEEVEALRQAKSILRGAK